MTKIFYCIIILCSMRTFAQPQQPLVAVGNSFSTSSSEEINFPVGLYADVPASPRSELPAHFAPSSYRNAFEVKAGYEFIRKMPQVIVGYEILLGRMVNIVPEVGFILLPTASLSLRTWFPVFRRSEMYAQAGPGWTFMAPVSLIAALGMEFTLRGETRMQIELRTQLFQDNESNRTVSVQGYNIITHRPITIMIGVSF